MNDVVSITGLVVRRGADFLLSVENLGLRSGSLYALVGPSGVGKSTLLRAIGGLLPIERGTVYIDGVGGLPECGNDGQSACDWRRRVHVIGQGQALLPYLTVAANVLALARDYQNDDADLKERFAKIAQSFNIQDLVNRYPSELSGGQYARAMLARSLTYRPRVLLMDEVSASIDPPLALAIFSILREELITENRVGLFVTHYVELARKIADRVIFLSTPDRLSVYRPENLERQSDASFQRFMLKT